MDGRVNPGQQPTVKNEQFYQVLFKLQGSKDIQDKVKNFTQDQRKLLNTIFYKLSKNEDIVLTKVQESVFEQIKTEIDRTNIQKKTQSVFERFANTVKTVLAFRVSSEHVIGNINKLHERLHNPITEKLPQGLDSAKMAAIDQALTVEERIGFREALNSVISLNLKIKSKEEFIARKRSEINAVMEGRGDENTKGQRVGILEKVIQDAEEGSVDKKNRPLDGIKQFKERLETAQNTLKKFIAKAEAAKVTVTDKKAEQKLHDEIKEKYKDLNNGETEGFENLFKEVLKEEKISGADLLTISLKLDPEKKEEFLKVIARMVDNQKMLKTPMGKLEDLNKSKEYLRNEFNFLRQRTDLKAELKERFISESTFNEAFDKLFSDPRMKAAYLNVSQDKREGFIKELKSLLLIEASKESEDPKVEKFKRQLPVGDLAQVKEFTKEKFLQNWSL